MEKFDLSYKTGHLLATVRTAITDLEARLSEIGPVNAEAIDATRRKMSELEVRLQENAAWFREAEAACVDHDQLRKLFADLAAAQEQYQLLAAEQPNYQTREKRLQEYQEAETHFKEKFKTLARAESELSRVEESYQRLVVRIETGEQKLAEAQQRCEQAQRNHADRDMIRARYTDWGHLLRICTVRRELERLAEERATSRAAYEQQQTRCAALKQQSKDTEEQWIRAISAQEQQATLRAVTQWHAQQREYEAERDAQLQQKIAQQRELDQVEAQKEQAMKATAWPGGESFVEIFNRLVAANALLKQDLRAALEKLAVLRVRQELTHAARQLTSGQACPLCGATHHPAVAHASESSEELEQQEKRLAQLQRQEAQHASLEFTLRALHNEDQSIRGRLEGTQQLLDANKGRLTAHRAQFSWETYRHHPSEALINQLNECNQWARQGKPLHEQRTNQLAQLEQQETLLAGAQQRWQQHQERWLNAKGKVENYRSLLQVISFNDHAQLTEAHVLKKQEESQFQLQDVEQKYEVARQQCQEYEKALGILEGKKLSEKNLLGSLRQEATATKEEIQTLCRQKKFESISYVEHLIDTKLDTRAEQSAVVAYRNRLHAAEENYKTLVQTTQASKYDAVQHREVQNARIRLQRAREELQQTWAVTKQELQNQQQKLIKAQGFDRSLEEQRLRESNLKELASLFRGSGFVNYASTVLLQEVCRGANVRFRKLTKNNLSLELNGDNDFIVRDYLNDGYTRLLKTLSGGQIFQAALCLALALAENIQSLNQSQQSFFFLDEGFGSLDKNALRVVFDTLKTLRQENRIVGIISHVEELQQEIDVYLTIEHHRERGSLVKNSWDAN